MINTIAAISINPEISIVTLIDGNDFYSNPRINPEGTKICWVAWDHPNMPWDGNELWAGSFDDSGSISQPLLISGGVNESIFQPEWSPDGILHFIFDQSGWWNPYCYKDGQIIRLCDRKEEFGSPQWVFGLSLYGFLSEKEMVFIVSSCGKNELVKFNSGNGSMSIISTHHVEYSSLDVFIMNRSFLPVIPKIDQQNWSD